ncbi:MAG: FecR family protein [Flavobacteriaceae bacterium]
MNSSKENMDEQLQKWLDGELSKDEWERYKNSSGIKDELDEMEGLVNHVDQWHPADEKRTTAKAWQALEERIYPETSKVIPIWKRPVLVAAAAATLLLLVSVWFFWDRDTQVYNPAGDHLAYLLPDNSQVQLNADSRVTFSPGSWNKNRLIKLQGEAFFEVKKGSTFTVETDYGNVTVLGTSCNIYSRNDKFEVACASGTVQVTTSQTPPVILTAGLATSLENGRLSPPQSFEEARIFSWQNGVFYYNGVELNLVLEELQRQLDLVIIDGGLAPGKLYTGFFDRKDPQQALQSVLKPMGLDFQIRGDSVYIE